MGYLVSRGEISSLKKNVDRSWKEKKKKLRFKRFDRSCYQEQENFFSASVYEVTNAWNIDSIDSNVSSLGLL